MKHFGPICGIIAAAAMPAILTGCGPAAYAPGSLSAAAAHGEISLDAAKPEGSFWEVEPGIRLYHFSRGTGAPVLVLHGGPGIASDDPWPGLGPLEKSHTFLYYHQRGCGKSTRPIDRFASKSYPRNMEALTKALGIRAQLADVERIRGMLGVERLTILGHSFGGFLAAMYAAEFPQNVERLVLAAPADLLRFPPPDGGLYERIRQLLPAESRPACQVWLGRFFDFGSVFQRSEADLSALNAGFFPFWQQAEAALQPTRGASQASDPALVGGWVQQAAFFSMGRKYDHRKALRRVSAPVLVLTGDRDPAGAASVEDYRSFADVRFQTLPGSGHFLQLDRTDFPRIVAEFLGG
ncbi:MAG: alpha/beta hydrolase [Spirochaetia bacterium]|jgi:proline iminopeptidase